MIVDAQNHDVTSFHRTGHLWEEPTSHQWIILTKASDTEIWCFLWSVVEQVVGQPIEMPVIWNTIVLIITSV